MFIAILSYFVSFVLSRVIFEFQIIEFRDRIELRDQKVYPFCFTVA